MAASSPALCPGTGLDSASASSPTPPASTCRRRPTSGVHTDERTGKCTDERSGRARTPVRGAIRRVDPREVGERVARILGDSELDSRGRQGDSRLLLTSRSVSRGHTRQWSIVGEGALALARFEPDQAAAETRAAEVESITWHDLQAWSDRLDSERVTITSLNTLDGPDAVQNTHCQAQPLPAGAVVHQRHTATHHTCHLPAARRRVGTESAEAPVHQGLAMGGATALLQTKDCIALCPGDTVCIRDDASDSDNDASEGEEPLPVNSPAVASPLAQRWFTKSFRVPALLKQPETPNAVAMAHSLFSPSSASDATSSPCTPAGTALSPLGGILSPSTPGGSGRGFRQQLWSRRFGAAAKRVGATFLSPRSGGPHTAVPFTHSEGCHGEEADGEEEAAETGKTGMGIGRSRSLYS